LRRVLAVGGRGMGGRRQRTIASAVAGARTRGHIGTEIGGRVGVRSGGGGGLGVRIGGIQSLGSPVARRTGEFGGQRRLVGAVKGGAEGRGEGFGGIAIVLFIGGHGGRTTHGIAAEQERPGA
jgi:hypothetical protein